MTATLNVLADPAALGEIDTLILVGRRDRLRSDAARALLPEAVPASVWDAMVGSEAKDSARTAETFTGGSPRRVVAVILPEHCSRHNAPSRAWAIPGGVRAAGGRDPIGVVLVLDEAAHAFAAVCAAATAFPAFSASSRDRDKVVNVAAIAPDGPLPDATRLQHAAEATRLAAGWVDTPPDRLNPTTFMEIATAIGHKVGAAVNVVEGRLLAEQGLGGLWAVGRASPTPPALVVLDHAPEGATRSIAWVGKGITYDTGGLSIKSKVGMPGMKTDMGGAAAVLAAFTAAVALGCPHRLTAVLCLAENAVGPDAMRPDDILTMYSGKTVEVNNTDAEGRLVLADGVAWVAKHRKPDDLVDLATLTGAQGIATGKRHAALYCNDEALEAEAVAAGRASGNTCHPMPYAPELFRAEFASKVADMKNSVADRSNAQVSCAAQFIGNHLDGFDGRWLHVDLAAPSVSSGRGTGYGVPLLLTLAGVGA